MLSLARSRAAAIPSIKFRRVTRYRAAPHAFFRSRYEESFVHCLAAADRLVQI